MLAQYKYGSLNFIKEKKNLKFLEDFLYKYIAMLGNYVLKLLFDVNSYIYFFNKKKKKKTENHWLVIELNWDKSYLSY